MGQRIDQVQAYRDKNIYLVFHYVMKLHGVLNFIPLSKSDMGSILLKILRSIGQQVQYREIVQRIDQVQTHQGDK